MSGTTENVRIRDYHTLPATLGCKDWFSAKVTTSGELDAAMDKVSTTDVASIVVTTVPGLPFYPLRLFTDGLMM